MQQLRYEQDASVAQEPSHVVAVQRVWIVPENSQDTSAPKVASAAAAQ